MTATSTLTLSSFAATDLSAHRQELGALLHACVHDGASIGFVLPFNANQSEAFWTSNVLPAVQAGTRMLLVAQQEGKIAGSVQLDYDTMANQPHRAEVRKLLVHPAWRRQGIARALMAELERSAQALGRSLLTLDTRTGDQAEPLYASLGYRTVGVIPGYCLDTVEDRLDATTVMYKTL
ncbi:GNAT family N-acetyltransferase [Paraburkholderia acidicola]|uniref:GNAT family N-acetyltransferase n=1 Tax=Paraburkholderia acidicola TaxID=1912599 RepID=A0ABV1LJY4_9BURK